MNFLIAIKLESNGIICLHSPRIKIVTLNESRSLTSGKFSLYLYLTHFGRHITLSDNDCRLVFCEKGMLIALSNN